MRIILETGYNLGFFPVSFPTTHDPLLQPNSVISPGPGSFHFGSIPESPAPALPPAPLPRLASPLPGPVPLSPPPRVLPLCQHPFASPRRSLLMACRLSLLRGTHHEDKD